MSDFARDLQREAERRGISVGREAAEAMSTHRELLARWNAAAKLTAMTDPVEVLDRHFLESLEALRFLPERAGRRLRLLDVGSGGGFPGLPLLMTRHDLDGELLEPASRKRAFLKEVVRATGLADRVKVSPDRIDRPDDLPPHGPLDLLTVRAVAGLPEIVAGAAVALCPGGRLLLFVGEEGASTVRAALPSSLRDRGSHPLPGRHTAQILVLERGGAA